MTAPDPVTVWMVHLVRGQTDKDVKGTLDLEDDALVLIDGRGEGALARLAFSSIRRVKRLRGSPVLMVEWENDGIRNRTAFYFTQPPPLHPAAGVTPDDIIERRPGPIPPMMRRSGKRKAQRTNAQYLQTSGISKKDLINMWAEAVTERIQQRG
jgi:hypothetical protein